MHEDDPTTRRRPQPGADPQRRRPAAPAGRDHDARPLSAASADARAGRPLRDPGLVRGAGLPDGGQPVPQGGGAPAGDLDGARHGATATAATRPSLVWSLGNENTSRPGVGFTRYVRSSRAPGRASWIRRGWSASPSPAIRRSASSSSTRSSTRSGVNDYFGWYPGPQNSIADRTGLSAYLERLHDDYRAQALFVTEFGAEATRAGPVNRKGDVCLPAGLLDLPHGRFRPEAVPERGAGLDPARFQGETRV